MIPDPSKRALEALDVGAVEYDAVVPRQALDLGATADVIVRLRAGRAAALKRWVRGERRTMLDLRASPPYLVDGHLHEVGAAWSRTTWPSECVERRV